MASKDEFTVKNGAIVGYNGQSDTVVIPDIASVIGNGAFRANKRLKRVVISRGITRIEREAFFHCENLESVTVADTVTHIASSAFIGCFALKCVSIPSSVESIGICAFADCKNLEKFEVDELNPHLKVEDNCIIERKTQLLVAGCKKSKISPSVRKIGAYAFRGCEIKSVDIPGSVTTIGEGAFSHCGKLKSVVLGEGVEELKDHAFFDCKSLETVILPNSIKSVGKYVFENAFKIKTSVYDNFKYLGNESNPYLYLMGEVDCQAERGTVKNGCRLIGAHTLYWCLELKKIKIPPSVTTIGEGVFSNLYDELTIYAKEGSVAQAYAQENGIKFQPIQG